MGLGVLGELNWPAVIVAALVYFGLGAVWYHPSVLGTAWMRSIGWSPSEEDPQMGAADYLAPLVAYLVASVAIGTLASATGSDSATEGIVLGLVVGIGVAATITFVTAVFDPNKPRPMAWFVINGAYHLLGLTLAAVIVSVWT